LKIYNILGEVVKTLVDEPKWAGDYTVQWDGKNDKGEQLASGVYFYELIVGEYSSAKKMILLK
jgi:flagellar hook assembly protein FlgD